MNGTGIFICAVLILAAFPGHAADLNAEQVRAIIAAAEPNRPANLSGRSLESEQCGLQTGEPVRGEPFWCEIGGGGPLRY